MSAEDIVIEFSSSKEGTLIMTDPKGHLADYTDILKRNGYKIIELNLKEGGTKWPNHSQKK